METKISNVSITAYLKKISTVFSLYYQSLILVLFGVIIIFGVYIAYSLTYSTIFAQEPIDPSIIKSQQEKINLQRYEETSKILEEKQKPSTVTSTIPRLFNN